MAFPMHIICSLNFYATCAIKIFNTVKTKGETPLVKKILSNGEGYKQVGKTPEKI